MIIIRIIFSIIFSLTILFSSSYAADNSHSLPNAGIFIQAGINAGNNLTTQHVVNAMDQGIGFGFSDMLKLLYQIGTLIAVCVFAFMGVKFFIASPQQKAQLKESLVGFFVGLLFFVAGVPIAILIINIFIQFL